MVCSVKIRNLINRRRYWSNNGTIYLLGLDILKNVIYSKIDFEEEIIKEKYIGAWESVNDIRVQAGEEKFNLIISKIKEKISELDMIKVPYKNTAWTAQRID